MDLIRKETLKNIRIAIRSQPVVGYICKFLSICTLQEKNVCCLFRCGWSVARPYHRYYKRKCWIYKGRAGIEIVLSTMKVVCVTMMDLSTLYYNPV
jgi:hypothetical protein